MDKNKAMITSRELDDESGYETGYEDRMIESLLKIKKLSRKRLVLAMAVERALETRRSIGTIKRIARVGFNVCAKEMKELIGLLDAMVRDKLLKEARKGKLGLVTKEEMVSHLKNVLSEFDGSYKDMMAEMNESKGDKDLIAIFDRFNKLLIDYERRISLLYEI